MTVYDDIQTLKGIGSKKAILLRKLGIHTVRDLLYYFPRDYEDRTKTQSLSDFHDGNPACAIVQIMSVPSTSRIRKELQITKFLIGDSTAKYNVVFFNQKYNVESLQYGKYYYLYGKLTQTEYNVSFINPIFESTDDGHILTGRIIPIYALTEGLTQHFFRKEIKEAIDNYCSTLVEMLPTVIREHYHIIALPEAIQQIHLPETNFSLEQAKNRFTFEKWFLFSFGLNKIRDENAKRTTLSFKNISLSDFYTALPYSLTIAQQKCIQEITDDLQKNVPMNRLLQGDVGAGKTIVALSGIYLAAKNGFQSVLLAPTEILAQQHFQSIAPLLNTWNISATCLYGSLPDKEKIQIRSNSENGLVQVLIGTHALLSEETLFRNLGFIIVDEQQRFGVQQRLTIRKKGNFPHTLVISATPIPRTLSALLYGDLNCSVLDGYPAGRLPISTHMITEKYRERLNGFIRKICTQGEQVFIVCPAVEEQEQNDLKSVQTWAKTLQNMVFPDLTISLLHGRMTGAEKESIMQDFSMHKADILVATTIIEVGIDVPDATLIVIEDAERFGLSQLHQLRGRVGRGSKQSYCILMVSHPSASAIERLKYFSSTNNGFLIAEKDYELRGGGDILGTMQHGHTKCNLNLYDNDQELLHQAQEAATDVFNCPEMQQLSEWAELSNLTKQLFSEEITILE